MMKWSLLELRKYQGNPLKIDTKIDIEQSLMARDETILSAGEVKVSGFLNVDETSYEVQLEVQLEIVVPSSRSLEPVNFPMAFMIDEVYMKPEQYELVKTVEGYEDVMVLETNTLDLREAIEDYVLLNIPMQVLTAEEKKSDKMPEGEFWKIMSEEEYYQQQKQSQKETLDPRFATLSALLDDNEASDDES
ncbi:hypothetical protein CBF29_06020 [Vagococcus elongatus]|uniref:Nucleic acid-binding protein n=2 Tax=Vagococcus elongatus TaxID=180344 RepID=A0A430AXA5_9ENTE|nr:hypothetical protein CBF29_06020 [Vagococcus elongatus]